ncbi:MAG: zinc ribbon domain-containing protein [Candidatus Bathyarchaeota archaeon]|nr:MAG: zinc ribbon domain-containing protein [Candidatus Bathyarchaeota archaeon]
MVYCVKCGAKNKKDAKYCGKCGATLEPSREKRFEKRAEEWGEEFGRRAEEWGEKLGKRAEEECFGLPHGGAIFGLLIGCVIILVGITLVLREIFQLTFGFDIIWPFFVIVFGLLFIAGAVYALTRK